MWLGVEEGDRRREHALQPPTRGSMPARRRVRVAPCQFRRVSEERRAYAAERLTLRFRLRWIVQPSCERQGARRPGRVVVMRGRLAWVEAGVKAAGDRMGANLVSAWAR
jgi:hypothetical protein